MATKPSPASTSLRAQILASKPALSAPVVVPEFGGATVYLRAMNGKQRERFESAFAEEGRSDVRASLLCHVLSDADGNLLFGENDIPAINELTASALIRLYNMAMATNAISDEQVEELAGNSSATPSN